MEASSTYPTTAKVTSEVVAQTDSKDLNEQQQQQPQQPQQPEPPQQQQPIDDGTTQGLPPLQHSSGASSSSSTITLPISLLGSSKPRGRPKANPAIPTWPARSRPGKDDTYHNYTAEQEIYLALILSNPDICARLNASGRAPRQGASKCKIYASIAEQFNAHFKTSNLTGTRLYSKVTNMLVQLDKAYSKERSIQSLSTGSSSNATNADPSNNEEGSSKDGGALKSPAAAENLVHTDCRYYNILKPLWIDSVMMNNIRMRKSIKTYNPASSHHQSQVSGQKRSTGRQKPQRRQPGPRRSNPVRASRTRPTKIMVDSESDSTNSAESEVDELMDHDATELPAQETLTQLCSPGPSTSGTTITTMPAVNGQATFQGMPSTQPCNPSITTTPTLNGPPIFHQEMAPSAQAGSSGSSTKLPVSDQPACLPPLSNTYPDPASFSPVDPIPSFSGLPQRPQDPRRSQQPVQELSNHSPPPTQHQHHHHQPQHSFRGGIVNSPHETFQGGMDFSARQRRQSCNSTISSDGRSETNGGGGGARENISTRYTSEETKRKELDLLNTEAMIRLERYKIKRIKLEIQQNRERRSEDQFMRRNMDNRNT
ncbi:hypothetical protein B0O80DRAFT_463850 [Mortierella sp. GBAus27b]|nr:hypothetical protein BGX31_010397 [Mortierella sp. GBA43]KAI8348157.1 hypothetical protein B0O80DRAFT_463850 [Mortierella sp. GBAus27b]